MNLILAFYNHLTLKKILLSDDNDFKHNFLFRLDWFGENQSKILLVFISFILLAVSITALFAPPNTVDALTYHLPRVAHWVQSGNVEFYPTNVERQLYNPPLAEYFILQLHLLAGSDQFSNLIQLLCFFAVGLITSLISKRFGLNSFGQLLTLLISFSISMGILQASSSKNDLVVSFFITAFFYYLLKLFENFSFTNLGFSGIALGLALLTKGNAFFFCFPIGFLIVLLKIAQLQTAFISRQNILSIIGVILIAISLNFTHFYRNYQLYGTPVMGEARLQNQQITAPILFSNIVRNYLIHFGTNFKEVNETVDSLAANILGDEIDNPASTVDNHKFHIQQSFNEVSAGNLFHIFFLTFCLIYFISFYQGIRKGEVLILSLSIVFGFILFCTFLKWNFWVSRVQLPLFFLGSPLIALLIFNKLRNISFLTGILFFVSAFFTIYVAAPRSLLPYDIGCVYTVPRNELYYSNNPNLLPIYSKAIEFVKDKEPDEIGLDLSDDYQKYNFGDWEYLIWVELKNDFSKKPILRHINVKNQSRQIFTDSTLPDWVISTRTENTIGNIEYTVVWQKNPIRILRKKVLNLN